jgi:hypothetical protein
MRSPLLIVLLMGIWISYPLSTHAWNPTSIAKMARKHKIQFPNIKGTTLNKKKRTFPSEFDQPLNIVLVGFARKHQKTGQTWDPYFASIRKTYPALDIVTIPAISGFGGLFQYFIINGMRKSVKGQKKRRNMVIVAGQTNAIRKAFRLTDTTRLLLALVSKSGNVLWIGRGPYKQTTAASLSQTLQALKQVSPTKP